MLGNNKAFTLAIIAFMQVLLATQANAQTQAARATPTLGQLADAQALKAQEEYLKSLDLASPSGPSGKAKLASDTVGNPLPPLAGVLPQTVAPSMTDKGSAASLPTGPLGPAYTVIAIYGPVNSLLAQIVVDGRTSVVRTGDRIGPNATVQTISAEAVSLMVTREVREVPFKGNKAKRANAAATTLLMLRPGETKS